MDPPAHQSARSAALLLREHGVAGTSIARVLEHSRAPRGSVQFHFPGGKAQLLTEALVRAGGSITNVLSQAQARGDTPAEVVNAICEHYERSSRTPTSVPDARSARWPRKRSRTRSSARVSWGRRLGDRPFGSVRNAEQEDTEDSDLALLCIS